MITQPVGYSTSQVIQVFVILWPDEKMQITQKTEINKRYIASMAELPTQKCGYPVKTGFDA